MASNSRLLKDFLREVVGADRTVHLISELRSLVLSKDTKAQEATENPRVLKPSLELAQRWHMPVSQEWCGHLLLQAGPLFSQELDGISTGWVSWCHRIPCGTVRKPMNSANCSG